MDNKGGIECRLLEKQIEAYGFQPVDETNEVKIYFKLTSFGVMLFAVMDQRTKDLRILTGIISLASYLKGIESSCKLQGDCVNEGLISRYPWLLRCGLVMYETLGPLLLHLLISACDRNNSVISDCIVENFLSEPLLRLNTIKALDIKTLFLCGKTLTGELLFDQRSITKAFSYSGGSTYISIDSKAVSISENVEQTLQSHIDNLREYEESIIGRRNEFSIIETKNGYLGLRPEDQAKTPFYDSDHNKDDYSYQIVIIKKDADMTVQEIRMPLYSFFKDFNFNTFKIEGKVSAGAVKRQFETTYAAYLIDAAEKTRDFYMLYEIRRILGIATEDECEYLERIDGVERNITKVYEIVPESVKIADSCIGAYIEEFDSFSYDCRLIIDGKTYKTKWIPGNPGTITVRDYHHLVEYKLTEEQIFYFWEETHADPFSTPFGKPISEKGNIEKIASEDTYEDTIFAPAGSSTIRYCIKQGIRYKEISTF